MMIQVGDLVKRKRSGLPRYERVKKLVTGQDNEEYAVFEGGGFWQTSRLVKVKEPPCEK